MEKRDYIEREIEKMRAVLQKIVRLRADNPQEAQAVIETEILRYFHHSLDEMINMTEASFTSFIETLQAPVLDFLGNLLYASVETGHALSDRDKILLTRTITIWNRWEQKTKTADWEKMLKKEQIRHWLSLNELS
jgi:spore coat polysaccharide biosynthesis protein SpsF (cytidylyltransferase family)